MFSRLIIKELSPKSKKIVDYLAKHQEKVINMTITNFAKLMAVYPSFVTKTLKRVGYNGWKDFISFALRDIVAVNPANDYGKYLHETLFKSITKSINNLEKVRLNILVAKITNQQQHSGIILAGNGYSLYICRDQNRRYNRINIKSRYIDEKTGEIHSIAPNKIILIVSISGHTSLTSQQLKYLKDTKKATLVLISGVAPRDPSSFDFIFNGSLIDNKIIIDNQAPTHSRIVIYVILDYIFWKIFHKNASKNNHLLEMLREH